MMVSQTPELGRGYRAPQLAALGGRINRRMAARLPRLLVALGLLLGAALPSAAAAVVRPPTSKGIARSPVPDRGADVANARSYFGARYLRADLGRFTTIDPVYTWTENLADPQRWNRYSYVRNNPLKYTDPTGEAIETLWDIANVVMGAKSAYENFKAGRYAAAAVDAVGVALDTGAVVVPGAPGGAGTAIKTARAVERVDDAIDAARVTRVTIDRNKKVGDAFRDEIATLMKAEGREVQTEVVKGTPFGPRRIDIEVSQGGQVLGGIETKAGGARYSPSQRAKDFWLKSQGYPVTVVRDR